MDQEIKPDAPKKQRPPAEAGLETGSPAAQTAGGEALAALALTTGAAVSTTAAMADLAADVLAAEPSDGEGSLLDQGTAGAVPTAVYGDFVRQVGLAVADAQKALDANSVAAAKELATTQIPALIALNQVVDEDGAIESVTPVVQENATLIQYIQPTFYQWSQVTLFARFDVHEFSADGSTKIQSSASASSRSGGLGGGLGFSSLRGLSGGLSGGFSRGSASASASTSVDTSFDTESASGTSYMVAELRPRTDTRFPPPIVAVQGPRLSMAATATSLPPPVEGTPSTLTISFTLFKKGGFKETSGKVVDLSPEGPGQLSATSVTLTPAADGDAKRLTGSVTLTRLSAQQIGKMTVRASLGALNASFAVDFPAPPPPPPAP